MKRQIIRGETIPLEMFPEALRTRAARVGAEALLWGGVVPPDIFQVLDATDEDLRAAQLHRMLTYADLDEWAQRQADSST